MELQEKRERSKKLSKDFCNTCPKEMTPDSRECKDCWVHWLSNEILNGDE